ncbi:MAG: ADP-ribosylglycohydrolase family protein [Chloroflexota bacterium]
MHEKIAGCLFGMAFGDALGAHTEFLKIGAILDKFPPNGPQDLIGNPAEVTDDTQMAIAVGDALLAAERPFTPDNLEKELRRTFIEWYDDPRNDRAPGMTCLGSTERLMNFIHWQEATNISSKGCGANMRVQPVGLLPVSDTERAGIAQLQAALTHGHATALAAADLTAWTIHHLLTADDVSDLIYEARAYAGSQRQTYREHWLGNLSERAYQFPTPQDFIRYGWDECIALFGKVEKALAQNNPTYDPCKLVGEAWIAEEAYATALYCFLLYPDDPVAVVRRAALTSGDSDSIACIAGAFAGAYKGLNAYPTDWLERIEYRTELDTIVDGLVAMW